MVFKGTTYTDTYSVKYPFYITMLNDTPVPNNELFLNSPKFLMKLIYCGPFLIGPGYNYYVGNSPSLPADSAGYFVDYSDSSKFYKIVDTTGYINRPNIDSNVYEFSISMERNGVLYSAYGSFN